MILHEKKTDNLEQDYNERKSYPLFDLCLFPAGRCAVWLREPVEYSFNLQHVET